MSNAKLCDNDACNQPVNESMPGIHIDWLEIVKFRSNLPTNVFFEDYHFGCINWIHIQQRLSDGHYEARIRRLG